MTTPTTDPILTPDEHRRLHAAFDAILADAPLCPNCGRPDRAAVLDGNATDKAEAVSVP